MIDFDENLLRQFEKKINENIDESDLFLSTAFKNTINNELADVVIDFFKDELYKTKKGFSHLNADSVNDLLFFRIDPLDKALYRQPDLLHIGEKDVVDDGLLKPLPNFLH